MSTSKSDDGDSEINLHNRALGRIDAGKPVIVDYQSNRGKQKRKSNSGKITHVQALGSDSYRFWFYDEDAERKIEVTLRDTIGKSRVRSQKTETWTVLGSPVQCLVSEESDTVEEIEQELMIGKRNNDFDIVVSIAEIGGHKPIIEWFARHNCL